MLPLQICFSHHKPSPPQQRLLLLQRVACALEDGLGVAFQMIGMKSDTRAQMDPAFKSTGFMNSFFVTQSILFHKDKGPLCKGPQESSAEEPFINPVIVKAPD